MAAQVYDLARARRLRDELAALEARSGSLPPVGLPTTAGQLHFEIAACTTGGELVTKGGSFRFAAHGAHVIV